MSSTPPTNQESFMDSLQRNLSNCWASTMTCGKNAKESTVITKLRYDIEVRKKTFGVAYLNQKKQGATEEELQALVVEAEADIAKLESQIQEKECIIEGNKHELRRKIEAGKTPPSTPIATAKPPEQATELTPTSEDVTAPDPTATPEPTSEPVAAATVSESVAAASAPAPVSEPATAPTPPSAQEPLAAPTPAPVPEPANVPTTSVPSTDTAS